MESCSHEFWAACQQCPWPEKAKDHQIYFPNKTESFFSTCRFIRMIYKLFSIWSCFLLPFFSYDTSILLVAVLFCLCSLMCSKHHQFQREADLAVTFLFSALWVLCFWFYHINSYFRLKSLLSATSIWFTHPNLSGFTIGRNAKYQFQKYLEEIHTTDSDFRTQECLFHANFMQFCSLSTS